MKCSTILSFLVLALPLANATPSRRHNEVAHRARGDVDKRDAFSNMRMTYFYDGLGACGEWNSDDDAIVAVNIFQFGEGYPGPLCYKKIGIWYEGNYQEATITDRCEVCPWGGLDLSPGLFGRFAPLSQGVLSASWWFLPGQV